nr:DUF6371 domain-containing protein [uncultured Psychroserpens sp.]
MNIHERLPSFHNDNLIGLFGKNYSNNLFIQYLKTKFVPVDIEDVIKRYFIGSSNHWNGATIFWQVDEEMRIRAGKVMLYNPSSGKRVKHPYPHINWMHKVLHSDNYEILNTNIIKCHTGVLRKDQNVLHKDNPFVLQQCLFGLHNLHNEIYKTIALVESEKTAIMMSIYLPCYLWMATGSKSNFKSSVLQPLKGRKIIAFPDKTEYKVWNAKSSILRKEGFNIVCSEILEKIKLEDGDDLVDLLLTNH